MFFSIITATYNSGNVIERMLISLEKQSYKDFNLIIQDGASTDNTMDIIEKYKDKMNISVESCKDTGIYNAWNKALIRSKNILGEWILFLGSDDELYDENVLLSAYEKLHKVDKSVLLAAGDTSYVMDNKVLLLKGSNKQSKLKYRIATCHTSLFNRKEIFDKHLFDDSFKIYGDYNFLLKTWEKESQCVVLGFIVSKMHYGGCSSNPEYALLGFYESIRAKKALHPIIALLQLMVFKTKKAIKWFFHLTSTGRRFWYYCKKKFSR